VVDPQSGQPTVPPSRALARRIVHAWRDLGTTRELAHERVHLPAILAGLAEAGVDGRPAGWVERRAVAGDPTIFLVGPDGGRPLAVIRVARGPAGRRGLVRVADALRSIRGLLAAPGIGVEAVGVGGPAVLGLVPVLLASGEIDGRAWLAETALLGQSGRSLLADPTERDLLLRRTVRGIAAVHAAGSVRGSVTDAQLERWVGRRVTTVRSILEAGSGSPAQLARLDRFESELRTTLRGRELSTGWIHGDLWPANVLVDARNHELSGIVDWDSAGAGELPLQDLLHLALTTRRLVERRALGEVVADLLAGAAWTADDLASVGATAAGKVGPSAFDGLDATSALRLYWLRAIELNVDRRPALARQRAWVRANVASVLA
jgi:aminoglycoside phosphotransferase (APT) family kinase protein